jgi:hypothetical protein
MRTTLAFASILKKGQRAHNPAGRVRPETDWIKEEKYNSPK